MITIEPSLKYVKQRHYNPKQEDNSHDVFFVQRAANFIHWIGRYPADRHFPDSPIIFG